MSLYENASKFVNSGSDKYIKLQPGSKTRLRILAHPYVSMKQFKAGGEIATRFHWPVWDYSANKVKILEQGPSVFNLIADVVSEYGEEVPMECDIVLGRTGDGLNTRYSVVPGKVQSELPKEAAEQFPNLAEEVKGGVPLRKFAEGEKPELQMVSNKTEALSVDDYEE